MKKSSKSLPVELRPIIHRFNGTGNLSPTDATHDQKEVINRHDIEIFTEACNAGQPFQYALGAVLMSGLMWARS